MVDYLQQIRSGRTLPFPTVSQFASNGFVTLPGVFLGAKLDALIAGYDVAMAAASGPDFKAASTTDRMSDLLSSSPVFAEAFLVPPLLEICEHFFGEPFKVSSLLARTLRAGTPAQALHADLPRDASDAPLLGFILMIDPFRDENGATRFVPGSQHWPDLPEDRMLDLRSPYPGEALSSGEPGSMIVFDAAVWHGHTANTTAHVRRSVQGYFVRRSAKAGFNFAHRLAYAVQTGLSPLARYLLALEG